MEILPEMSQVVGIIVLIGLFYFIGNWRPIFWFYIVLPLSICLILTIKFFRETPSYLIRLHSIEEIRSQLLFIARLNGR